MGAALRWDAEEVKSHILPRIEEVATSWGIEFTGKRRKGWLECHAAGREDIEPSAAIHEDTGVYKDMADHTKTLSIFELAIKLGAYNDFPSAVNGLGERYGVPPSSVPFGNNQGYKAPKSQAVRKAPDASDTSNLSWAAGPAVNFTVTAVGADPVKKKARRKPYGHPSFEAAAKSIGWALEAELVGYWAYRKADGSELFRIARFNTQKGKTYRPFHLKQEVGWVCGDPEGLLPLYHLPELAGATMRAGPEGEAEAVPVSERGQVWVFEGEKIVDMARDLGLIATTSSHGAKSADKSDWSPIAGRDVVVVPDVDDNKAGDKYAAEVVELLAKLDPPPSIRLLNLPGLGDGEDFEQWLERVPGEWDNARTVAELREMAAKAPDPTKPQAPDDLKARVTKAIEAGGWEGFFEGKELLAQLAQAEQHDPGLFAQVMARLQGFKGWRAGTFKTAMRPHREAVARKVRAEKAEKAPEWRTPPQYHDAGDRLVVTTVDDEGEVRTDCIAQFSARIVADTILDDRTEEPERQFTIKASAAGQEGSKTVDVRAADFDAMGWVTSLLGPSYIINVGRDNRAHVRNAIQYLSGHVPETRTYITTGWHQVDGEWCYIHGRGGIRAAGNDPTISVDLSQGPTRLYNLPDPPEGDELRSAIRASLGMFRLGDPSRPMSRALAASLWAFAVRAAVGPAGFTLQLYGSTGSQKSSVAALAQQHYGPAMERKNFPANWESDTPLSILEAACVCADAVMLVDDFISRGSNRDVEDKHKSMASFLQSVGNQKGRARAGLHGGVRATRAPLASVISTGEDRVKHDSADARTFPVRVASSSGGGVRTVDLGILTLCQEDAKGGLYASAMAGYIRWLTGRIDEVRDRWDAEVAGHRDRVSDNGLHSRTPEIVGELCVGAETFLRFAVDVGAIDQAEADSHNLMIQDWLAEGVDQIKADRKDTADVGTIFLGHLASVLQGGKVFLSAKDYDGEPKGRESNCGWKQDYKWFGNAEGQRLMWLTWPNAARIGWVDDDYAYIDPAAAYKAVREHADRLGEGFGTSRDQTYKVLIETGRIDHVRGGKDAENRITSRVLMKATCRQQRVHKIPVRHLWPDDLEGAAVEQEGETL